MSEQTTVAIIGAGPAGLTAAIQLAQRGIDAVLLERRAATSHLPRAHLLNVRTMEVFAAMGVADDVEALSPPQDRWHRVGWRTSLAGPTPLHGREIGHVQAWGGGTDAPRYAEASPRAFANVPQMHLDPLLLRHAETARPGAVRFEHEVVGMRHDDVGATLTVTDRTRDETYELDARYVIAADGGRICARLLGVEMVGPTQILELVSQHLAMDLSPWFSDDQVLLTYFINPDGAGTFAGSLCQMGPDRWGSDSPEWVLHLAFQRGDPAAHDPEALMALSRRLLGIPDLQMTVRSTSHWWFEGVVADRFRVGPVFLVGNAAHRHPPTGGLGLNAAVQDVDNLVWKLHAVIAGHADPALLDTYETERRPVNEFYVQHSLDNAGAHANIGRALGLQPGQTEDDAWAEIAVWDSDTERGAERRAAVAQAVAEHADDYSQLGVEAGFAYEAGAIVADGTEPPLSHGSLRDFTPTGRPGHHLPHIWLQRGAARVSTIDLVAPDRLTLFTGEAGARRWGAAAVTLTTPIALVVINGEDGAEAEPGTWARVCGIGPDGALLVRPDRVVAWRAPAADGELEPRLHAAVLGLLGAAR